MLNQDFLQTRLDYFVFQLSKYQTYTIGYHKSIPVIYIRENNKILHEYHTDSKAGKLAIAKMLEKERINTLFRKYKLKWDTTYKNPYLPANDTFAHGDNKVVRIPLSMWEEIKISAKKEEYKNPKEYTYAHKNIALRSRFEMAVAEVIDDLNFEFCYEATVKIGMKLFYPDFVVRIPELGCCIIIEALGGMGMDGYIERTSKKMERYAKAGLFINRDVIYIHSDGTEMPESKQIAAQLSAILDSLTYTLWNGHGNGTDYETESDNSMSFVEERL